MPTIDCTSCHVGQLTSLNVLYQALQEFPLPEGMSRGKPCVDMLEAELTRGVRGEIKAGFSGSISMTSNPDSASLRIITDLPGDLQSQDKQRIREFLDKFFGAKVDEF